MKSSVFFQLGVPSFLTFGCGLLSVFSFIYLLICSKLQSFSAAVLGTCYFCKSSLISQFGNSSNTELGLFGHLSKVWFQWLHRSTAVSSNRICFPEWQPSDFTRRGAGVPSLLCYMNLKGLYTFTQVSNTFPDLSQSSIDLLRKKKLM